MVGALLLQMGSPASETRCGCAHMALIARALVTPRLLAQTSRPGAGFFAQRCHPPLLTRNPHARQVDACRAESGTRLSLLPLYGMPHFLSDPRTCSRTPERNSMMRSCNSFVAPSRSRLPEILHCVLPCYMGGLQGGCKVSWCGERWNQALPEAARRRG